MRIITRTRAQVYKLWLAALRSGEYKRVKGQLRKTDTNSRIVGYCCLGVLQDLAAKDGGNKLVLGDHNDRDYRTSCGEVDEIQSMPQQEILDFMGLDSNTTWDLIEMNDDKNRSFKEIANHIEKNILPEVI